MKNKSLSKEHINYYLDLAGKLGITFTEKDLPLLRIKDLEHLKLLYNKNSRFNNIPNLLFDAIVALHNYKNPEERLGLIEGTYMYKVLLILLVNKENI